ncbi:MAG: hypothetical protein H6606_10245 [Flavobacteriales bacterium]|nr:hypothetical protein [Flavobacteriales bacterium]
MKTSIRSFLPVWIAVVFGALIMGLSIYSFETYGLSVFLLGPFLLGFIPAWMQTRRNNTGFVSALKYALLTLMLALILMLILLLEGIVCISMALPILVLLNIMGAGIGHLMARRRGGPTQRVPMYVLLLTLLVGTADFISPDPELRSVTTTIHVHAPIEHVWQNVVEFDTIREEASGIFRFGIACPTHADLRNENGQLVRYCHFSTGPFVEPITSINAPTDLQFDVRSQPDPMSELNPFGEVRPPHLSDQFRSEKGAFQLTPIDSGNTLLQGTTWYRSGFRPSWYWDSWSRFIIHRIHLRVLDHIATTAEEMNN